MEMGAPLVSLAARHAGRADWLIPVLQTAGLVGRTLDMEIFRELAAQFAMLDFRVYSRTLEALGRHDALDVLPTVQVPCLMITGDRDLMTPLRTAHEIERTIPDCRLRVLAGASHYAAVEFPREVGDWIVSFLETIGYPGGAVT
jgi:pimeloyl-ACP methyl ester carboxylesterase